MRIVGPVPDYYQVVSELRDLLTKKARDAAALPTPEMRRAIRVGAGLTQLELGRVVGVAAASISRYESADREPRGEHRARYAAALAELRRG